MYLTPATPYPPLGPAGPAHGPRGPHHLGSSRFASRTPSVFLSFFLYPLFSFLFSENSVDIVKFWALSRVGLRLVWAQNQPNFRPNRQNAGNFAENPCIPGTYPATAWVFCRFPQFCLRFCPRPALRLRETREFPEWSTKHPLFSLEISGNAKCWGPSVFLFVFRKTWLSPTGTPKNYYDLCLRVKSNPSKPAAAM